MIGAKLTGYSDTISSYRVRRLWTLVPRDPLSRLAALVLLTLIVLALAGPVLPLGDPRAIGVGPRLAPPGHHWLLGTDSLGRSLLPRVVQGIRNTFLLAALAVSITVAVATFIGLLATYRGGWLDSLVVRVADAMFSFPALLLAILVAAIAGPGSVGAIVTVVLVTLPLMVRVIRAATLLVAERDFVAASEVAGAPVSRILIVHLLPNIAGPLIVQATYALSIAMLTESSLSFLGLGTQFPEASLGSLVSDGSIYLLLAPGLVLFPGAILALAILSVNLVGDGLRDMVDPRVVRTLR